MGQTSNSISAFPSLRDTADIRRMIGTIKRIICERRPILGQIMESHGADTLYEYTRDFMDVNKVTRAENRRQELIETAKEIIGERLGKEIGEASARQLYKLPLVSTADHHGPLTHPFFVNSNIISALPYTDYNDPDVRFLIVFSFATVSLNNSSFPRGITFHGGMNGTGNFIRLPILPDRLKMGVVHGMRAMTQEDLVRAGNELSKRQKSGELEAKRAEQVRSILDNYFGASDVLQCSDFSAQVTKMNWRLWPDLFKKNAASPGLVYLEIETLVSELLIRHHLMNQNSLFYRLLFHPEWQRLVLELFNNLPGAFSLKDKWGTYFFWARDAKCHRVQLALGGGKLYSHDREYVYDFTPEEIVRALQEKQIFPGMSLCYLLVPLYYGMKCLGGFCQVNDLTMTKEAWVKLLSLVGEAAESEAALPIQTKELGGDGLVLAYLRTPKGNIVPATGIDMIMEEPKSEYNQYIALAKNITLAEAISPLLPVIYTVLYSIHERDAALSNLTAEEIVMATNLYQKLAV